VVQIKRKGLGKIRAVKSPLAARRQQTEAKQWLDLEKKLKKMATEKSSVAAMNLFNYLDWVSAHCV
jgi:hypothetical protein